MTSAIKAIQAELDVVEGRLAAFDELKRQREKLRAALRLLGAEPTPPDELDDEPTDPPARDDPPPAPARPGPDPPARRPWAPTPGPSRTREGGPYEVVSSPVSARVDGGPPTLEDQLDADLEAARTGPGPSLPSGWQRRRVERWKLIRGILTAKGPQTYLELAKAIGISREGVRMNLEAFEKAGLIRLEATGQPTVRAYLTDRAAP